MAAILQKLIESATGQAISSQGEDQVGGLVVAAGDASAWRTPKQILHAYGYDADVAYVDVVRFTQPLCSGLSAPPADPAPRPWPTFPAGFLRDGTPAWVLSRTRYSPGAEYWRVHADGRQEFVTAYQGAARGWAGASGWRPAARFVGTRARWQGGEYVADVAGDEVTLTVLAESAPEGWTSPRPNTWYRAVPRAECQVFEYHYEAKLGDVGVRVLASDGGRSRVLLEGSDPEVASRLGAFMVESGVFEAIVDNNDLADFQPFESVAEPA